jgi:hypothetical protein
MFDKAESLVDVYQWNLWLRPSSWFSMKSNAFNLSLRILYETSPFSIILFIELSIDRKGGGGRRGEQISLCVFQTCDLCGRIESASDASSIFYSSYFAAILKFASALGIFLTKVCQISTRKKATTFGCVLFYFLKKKKCQKTCTIYVQITYLCGLCAVREAPVF